MPIEERYLAIENVLQELLDAWDTGDLIAGPDSYVFCTDLIDRADKTLNGGNYEDD